MTTYTVVAAAACKCGTTEVRGSIIIRVGVRSIPPQMTEPTIPYVTCILCGSVADIPVKRS